MARYETWFTTNLQAVPKMQTIHGNMFTQDNMGNLIGVHVMDGTEPATLSGTVAGYVIRLDGNTVVLSGTLSGSDAYIELPESAYAVPGQISIFIRLVNGDDKVTLLACTCYVTRSRTGSIIDPGEVIPDIDELLEQIEAMEEATAAANAAAAAVPDMVAPTFSTSTAYTAGQYVYYDGYLYRFTADHTAGAWDASEAVQVTVSGEAVVLSSAICDEVTIPSSDWGVFALNSATGFPTDNTKRITTKYLLDNVAWVRNSDTTNYRFALAAYDRDVGTYIGFFDGSTFGTGIAWISAETLRVPTFEYKYLVVLRKTSDTDMAISDGSVITLGMARYLDPNSQDIGYGDEYSFVKGGINSTNGAENTSAARSRTGFIPIAGSAGSSVDIVWNIDMLNTYQVFGIFFYKNGSFVSDVSITWGLSGVRIPVSSSYNQVRLVFKRRNDADFTDSEVATFMAKSVQPYNLKQTGDEIAALKARISALESVVIDGTTLVLP